jgi:heat shock protein HslJ
MLTKIFSLLIFFISCYCSIMCLSCQTKLESETLPFWDTQWTLESLYMESNIVKPPKDQLYTAQFRADSSVTGNNDCNEYYAKYLLGSDNSLKLMRYQETEVGCGDDWSITSEFSQTFREAKSYKIYRDRLYVFCGLDSKLVFYGE